MPHSLIDETAPMKHKSIAAAMTAIAAAIDLPSNARNSSDRTPGTAPDVGHAYDHSRHRLGTHRCRVRPKYGVK